MKISSCARCFFGVKILGMKKKEKAPAKNRAAVHLANLRWKGVDAKERSDLMKKAVERREELRRQKLAGEAA